MGKKIDRTIDWVESVTSDQTSRTGYSAARADAALANGVDADVIALQATRNSQRNNPDDPITFTGDDIVSVGKWYRANQSRPALTKAQAGEIIRAQRAADSAADGVEPDPIV